MHRHCCRETVRDTKSHLPNSSHSSDVLSLQQELHTAFPAIHCCQPSACPGRLPRSHQGNNTHTHTRVCKTRFPSISRSGRQATCSTAPMLTHITSSRQPEMASGQVQVLRWEHCADSQNIAPRLQPLRKAFFRTASTKFPTAAFPPHVKVTVS